MTYTRNHEDVAIANDWTDRHATTYTYSVNGFHAHFYSKELTEQTKDAKSANKAVQIGFLFEIIKTIAIASKMNLRFVISRSSHLVLAERTRSRSRDTLV